ncbi:hypothetical protein CPB83DRAFT_939915 [Crepidotus variabilis]|uniref:Uncharacterized protein n=1 Tax=Crepidotus variabilis TaxID=179855 RepID=A0A9P6JMG7_9AGAR|nr:hypothetical protein CPB83DRAFT_939915 [Crepidotus variabilis]
MAMQLDPTVRPPVDAPWYIIAWIMEGCDEVKLDGSIKALAEHRGTYAHAQKMRASMTYAFGRIHGMGSTPWVLNDATTRASGNPSMSEKVATYMISLKNRKVRAGEAATSARAITTV